MKPIQLLIVCLFLSFGSIASAQPIRFQASSVSFTDKKADGKWNEWSDFVDAKVLITVDAKKNLITINSSEIQSFKIKAYGEITDNDEVNIVPFECVDNKFSKCNILIITKKRKIISTVLHHLQRSKICLQYLRYEVKMDFHIQKSKN